MDDKEEWRPLCGYENFYDISSMSRIRRSDREQGTQVGRLLKPKANTARGGYIQVVLTANKVSKTKRLHRLVAKTFIPNPLELPEVNHKNGLKHDNRSENLEWVTSKQNSEHALRLGLVNLGSKRPNAVLTEKIVQECRIAYAKDFKLDPLVSKFGIGKACIWAAVTGKTWKWVQPSPPISPSRMRRIHSR